MSQPCQIPGFRPQFAGAAPLACTHTAVWLVKLLGRTPVRPYQDGGIISRTASAFQSSAVTMPPIRNLAAVYMYIIRSRDSQTRTVAECSAIQLRDGGILRCSSICIRWCIGAGWLLTPCAQCRLTASSAMSIKFVRKQQTACRACS